MENILSLDALKVGSNVASVNMNCCIKCTKNINFTQSAAPIRCFVLK